MAKNENKRLPPGQIQADREAHTAAETFSDYRPANPAYSVDALDALLEAMQAAREAEVNAANAMAAARDAAVAAEWAYHNTILGVKKQVVAQYGNDSDEMQSLGLTKKSERKRPTPSKVKTG
jgi:hypothetical protein